MSNKKKDKYLLWSSIAVVVVFGVGLMIWPQIKSNPNQESLDRLATCIADSGAKFYGAFWCSHCNNQKEAFGNSKNLPYIECSTADGNSQTEECRQAGINGYPTWEFADGERVSGEISLSRLADLTGCEYSQ